MPSKSKRALVAITAVAALIATLGVSSATADARVPEKNTKFCKVLGSNQGAGIDFEGLSADEATFAAKLVRSLAKAGVPTKLKSDLKKIAKVYDRIAEGESAAEVLDADGQAALSPALTRFSKYVGANCRAASATESATVPHDCSALKTSAVSALLGGAPVLDSDSEFNTTLEQLHCIWYTNDAVTEKVSVQLGVADDFIGFYGSQEGTGTSKYTKVGGFDEGRLYGEDILIAKRNGFAVAVDARSVYPQSTQEQIVAVALEATAS